MWHRSCLRPSSSIPVPRVLCIRGVRLSYFHIILKHQEKEMWTNFICLKLVVLPTSEHKRFCELIQNRTKCFKNHKLALLPRLLYWLEIYLHLIHFRQICLFVQVHMYIWSDFSLQVPLPLGEADGSCCSIVSKYCSGIGSLSISCIVHFSQAW